MAARAPSLHAHALALSHVDAWRHFRLVNVYDEAYAS
jgi:hypothetical protein